MTMTLSPGGQKPHTWARCGAICSTMPSPCMFANRNGVAMVALAALKLATALSSAASNARDGLRAVICQGEAPPCQRAPSAFGRPALVWRCGAAAVPQYTMITNTSEARAAPDLHLQQAICCMLYKKVQPPLRAAARARIHGGPRAGRRGPYDGV